MTDAQQKCAGSATTNPGNMACCKFVNAAAGTLVGIDQRHCQTCMRQGGNGNTPMCRALIFNAIAAQLIAGDLPRYARPGRLPMETLFERFAAIASPQQQADLIQRMFRYQAKISESNGGVSARALAERFVSLAKRFRLTAALEEFVHSHTTGWRNARV